MLSSVVSRVVRSAPLHKVAARSFGAGAEELKSVLAAQIPGRQAKTKAFLKEHGEVKLGDVTISQAYGGMRDIKCMVWETSLLDKDEGIRFRGRTIPELQKELPATLKGGEPGPEALVWLLLTGQVPTKAQTQALTDEFHARGALPAYVVQQINNYPKNMHPMTQLSSAILALQTESVFAAKYREGCPKSEYWAHSFEDTMTLLARLPSTTTVRSRSTTPSWTTPLTSTACSATTRRTSTSSCACTSSSTRTTRAATCRHTPRTSSARPCPTRTCRCPPA
jgi:citrate synthase